LTTGGDSPGENAEAPGTESPDGLLAAGLAAGLEIAEAAKVANVSESTAYRRLRDPAFRHLVAELRGKMVEQAVGRLAASMTKAADRLVKLLDSKSERVRLNTAKAIIGMVQKLREQTEIEDRLAALEAAAVEGSK
jgi:hypothetical protein